MEFVIGVDLGAAQLTAAVAGRDGRLLGRTQTEIRPQDAPDAALERLALQIKYAASQVGFDPRQAVGIGIATADPQDLRLKSWLEGRFGAPVGLMHAGQAGALGEHRYGAGRGSASMLYLQIGSSISGGIISGGQVLTGGTAMGHLLVDIDGPACACGARGCLEAIASGWAIGRAGQEAAMTLEGERIRMLAGGDPRKVTGAVVARAAEYGDLAAMVIMDRAAKGLGMALGGLINLLGPERIVLGGSVVTGSGRLFLAKLAEAARKQALTGAKCPIALAELGADSALRGAVALAVDTAR